MNKTKFTLLILTFFLVVQLSAKEYRASMFGIKSNGTTLNTTSIQQAIDYYDEQQIGLGERFENTLNKHLIALENNPFYRIRYDNIRCLPIRKFPYMVHYTVEEVQKLIIIRAVFHTSLDPENWKEKG